MVQCYVYLIYKKIPKGRTRDVCLPIEIEIFNHRFLERCVLGGGDGNLKRVFSGNGFGKFLGKGMGGGGGRRL